MFFLLSGLTINKNESGQEWAYTYQGLYAYNHQTGQSGKVIDAEITAYAVDEEQEQIYYFVYADGLYVQNRMKKQKLRVNVLFLQQTEVCYMNFRLIKRDICCLEMGIIFLPNRL